jgi:predicted MPP superfamily phosphohydrolase
LSGAHDYRIRKVKLALPNLPKEFEGLTIAQISDIHSGSFFNKVAVKGGIEMILNAKPDMVFFTGDLVNNQAVEVQEYIDLFGKVKAPLGVFSTLGNHDYGDYVQWASPAPSKKILII